MIEPGFVETAIWSKALPLSADQLDASEPYRSAQLQMMQFEAAITNRTSAATAAEEVYRAVRDPVDRMRYPIAAYARSILAARRLLGDSRMMRFFHRRWMGSDAQGG